MKTSSKSYTLCIVTPRQPPPKVMLYIFIRNTSSVINKKMNFRKTLGGGCLGVTINNMYDFELVFMLGDQKENFRPLPEII